MIIYRNFTNKNIILINLNDQIMTAAVIGISSGLLIIFLFQIFKHLDKTSVYGLILSGIGFLYVGYVWMDVEDLVVNSIQAVIFLLIAYTGMKKPWFLAIGFFLHGCWDIAYPFLRNPGLIPPHYDIFCSTLDFVIAIYLLLINKKLSFKNSPLLKPTL